MKLIVNGETKEISEETVNVKTLLDICKVEMPDMVSVQINQQFIDKSVYAQTSLKESDEVDFLYFLGGGAQ